jgi:uncharacterized protein
MQYRKFGRLDWKPSALGFGAMRLPQFGTERSSPVNHPDAIKMIRYAIDHGVNYVDTAFPYNMGDSERTVGEALQDGYREKVRLATKLSSFTMKSGDELESYFESQLKRLQTDKIDFYLLHSMNANYWKTVNEWKVFDFLEKKMAEGKIGYLGFSFHDQHDIFKKVVDGYDNWTFCQVQYNFLDEHNQAGRKGVEYAASKGLAVVVMEPLRGGQLAKDPPPAVAKEWVEAEKKRSRVEWALDWIWNQPEISLLLSGMSTKEQTVQNVLYAERSAAGMLSSEDMKFMQHIIKAYKSLHPLPCTGCGYCQPCPNGVNIPRIFEYYNEKIVNQDPHSTLWYNNPGFGISKEQRADNCVECGECVKVCPQQINIPEQLKKAHLELTKDAPPPPPPRPSFKE